MLHRHDGGCLKLSVIIVKTLGTQHSTPPADLIQNTPAIAFPKPFRCTSTWTYGYVPHSLWHRGHVVWP